MAKLDPLFCEKMLLDTPYMYHTIVNFNTYECVYANEAFLKSKNLQKIPQNATCHKLLFNRETPCNFCKRIELLHTDCVKHQKYNKQEDMFFIVMEKVFEHDGQKYISQTFIDVTAELKEIDYLKLVSASNNVIIDCTSALYENNDTDIAVQKFLKILGKFYDTDCEIICERDFEQNVASTRYHHCFNSSPFFYENFNFNYDMIEHQAWLDLTSKQVCLYLLPTQKEVEAYPIKDGAFALRNCENILVIPLHVGDINFGVLYLYNVKKNRDKFEVFEKISALIGNMLSLEYSKKEREKSFVLLEQKERRKNALLECSNTLMSELEVEKSIDTFLKIIGDYFEADAVFILNRDMKKEILTYDYSFYAEGQDKSDEALSHLTYADIEEWFNLKANKNVVFISSLDDLPTTAHNTDVYKFLKKQSIHCFLFAPIIDRGENVGFLWIRNPKKNMEDREFISTASAFIVSNMRRNKLLENLKQLSFTDTLSGLRNRNAYNDFISKNKTIKNLGIIYCDINGLKFTNDSLGHEYGDILIKWCGHFLKEYAHNFAFRVGGDEFICLFTDTTEKAFNSILENMNKELAKIDPIHISIGSLWNKSVDNLEAQVCVADKQMFEAKQNYYSSASKDRRNKYKNVNLKELKDCILALAKELSNGEVCVLNF